MWKKSRLQLSRQAKTALEQNLKGVATPFPLTVTGQKMGLHNWTHGIKEPSGRYLSPENAVKVIADKLTDYSDPNRPGGTVQSVGIMITAQRIEDFIAEIEKVAVLLPDTVFKQALDYAKSQQHLVTTKMIKTQTIGNPSLSPSADITPGSARMLQGIMRNALATASAVPRDPMQALNALKARKAEKEAENNKKVTEMLKATANIYSISTTAQLEQTALEILNGVPDATHIFTVVAFFIGADLSNLRSMIV